MYFLVKRLQTDFMPNAALTNAPSAMQHKEAAQLDVGLGKAVIIYELPKPSIQLFLTYKWQEILWALM
jgi:hypothetical protein